MESVIQYLMEEVDKARDQYLESLDASQREMKKLNEPAFEAYHKIVLWYGLHSAAAMQIMIDGGLDKYLGLSTDQHFTYNFFAENMPEALALVTQGMRFSFEKNVPEEIALALLKRK